MLSRIFLRGLVVVLPIVLTIAVVIWLAVTMENYLGGLIREVYPGYWPGLGTLAGMLIVFAVGILVHDPITRWLLGRAEGILERIPVVKTIYLAIRDIAAYMSQDSQKGFRQVVAVRVQDMRLIGFVTAEGLPGLPPGGENAQLVGVYLPMSYGIGGYTVYLPREQLEPLDMPLEDAMRLALIGGVSQEKERRQIVTGDR